MKRLDTHRISKYLHGTFGEFFGSTTYDGLWVGKDSDIPNVGGIRLDVIEGIRECGLTVFRWPGGCCAEKYHWMDGIGPNRMPRMHFQRDNNHGIWDMSFGTDEFMELCRLCDMEPMIVANVSTGTVAEFRDWYEYCNAPATTKFGAMRAANGHPEPYNVKFFGIGNTDENAWKAAFIPEAYAIDYVRFVSALDGSLNASQDPDMPDGCVIVGLGLSIRHGHHDWPKRVMDLVTCNGTMKGPDMLSVHHYLGSMKNKKCGDAVDYTDEEYYYLLDSLPKYEEDIAFHRTVINEHACKRKPTYISFDEWGTWHDEDDVVRETHQRQTVRDAIFAAMALHIFYRNSDVVKMAMQTQICNLNESLFDTDGKNFLKTPTFYVMKLFRDHLNQYLLDAAFNADSTVDALASVSEDGCRVTVTAANRDLYREACLTLCDELSGMKIVRADIVTADDVRAVNTYAEPELVRDLPFEATLPKVTLPPHSVVRIVLEKQ
ncbi:MAG: hypothetical protein E7617_04825 [Ruminococcaceae bacterium]|nr:hypothetical protein [Oscillospiraceae bacterium]